MKSAILIRLLVVSIAALASSAAWPGSARATPPFLDPIANMSVTTGGCSGSTADQTISANDPDGDAITFISQGPVFMTLTSNPQVGNTRTGNIHVAPPPGTSGNFPATVTATANSESVSRSFTISVVVVNQPPVLNQPANMTVNIGATANQTLTGSDPCSAPLTFTKVSGPTYMTVTTVNATTGNVNLAPGFADEGTATVMVRATNPDGIGDTKSFMITVNHADHPPVMSQPANMTVNEGATANNPLSAMDADGQALTFAKVSGPTYATVTTTTPGTGTATGNVNLAPGFSDSGTATVSVSVSDGSASNGKTFTVTVNNVNRPPILAQPANMTVTEGSIANQTLTATDPDGNSITFSKVSGPTYVTVTTTSPGAGTGNINLAPGFNDAGTATVTVRAMDNGSPPLANDKSFTVTVNCTARAHVLNQPADMTVNEGATANQTLTATDPDGDPITFSKVSGPTYVTVTTTSPGTGTATGNVNVAPGFSDAGTASVTVAASAEGCGGLVSVSKSFTVTVNDAPPPGPNLGQPANMTMDEGATANQTLNASDPDGDPLTFSKVAGPTFMTVTTTSSGTGTATGNVNLAPGFSDSGTYTASVRVSDASTSTDKSFTITALNVNRAPSLNPVADMIVPVGSTRDQAISGSDPDGDALTFAKVTGPTFMTVTTTSPTTGNIHVAPGFGDGGAYPATARASDGNLSSDRSFTIVVCLGCVNRAPTLNPVSNMTVAEGATADQGVTATDADGDAITLTAMGPIFMTFTTFPSAPGSASGQIHLAPGFSDAGSYTATVRASDGALTDSKSFTILVNSACSGQPEANPGGPYQGFVNVPIQFDGSGSSDPSGAPLTFEWDFGDGATAAGMMPVHTYTTLGIYTVTLTVTGECGTSTGSTIAEIRPACDALAFTRGGNRTIRLNSGRPTACVQIEPQGGCYRNEEVILSSLVMKYTGGAVTEIHAISDKTTVDSDTNGDGIAEITACFRKEDLRQLFSGLPGGESNPVVGLEGDLTTGGRFQTTVELRVISGGGTSAATVSPNPFNPAGTLTFTTARPGFARVELFDVGGRLLRTILDEPSLGAGLHEVRIEGRGQRGESLASGIYFIRGISAEGEFTKTITILK